MKTKNLSFSNAKSQKSWLLLKNWFVHRKKLLKRLEKQRNQTAEQGSEPNSGGDASGTIDSP